MFVLYIPNKFSTCLAPKFCLLIFKRTIDFSEETGKTPPSTFKKFIIPYRYCKLFKSRKVSQKNRKIDCLHCGDCLGDFIDNIKGNDRAGNNLYLCGFTASARDHGFCGRGRSNCHAEMCCGDFYSCV